jgi:hypothetical protein
MNKKWRILIGICLVVMICVPMVSAAFQIPTIKHSFNRSYLDILYPEQSNQEIQAPFDTKTMISFNNTKKVDFSQLTRYSFKPSALSPVQRVPMCGDPEIAIFIGGVLIEDNPLNSHPFYSKGGCVG